MEASDNWRTIVVFRNDDPSACSVVGHERRIADLFDRYGIRQTVGVVPLHCNGDQADPGSQEKVRLDKNAGMVDFLHEYIAHSGSEIALHGCTHQNNKFGRPTRRLHYEFEGLELERQEELISLGTEVLVDTLGVRPCTFIPPWNRADRNTVLACVRQGYRIISSGPFTPTMDGIMSLGMNCELDTFPSLFARAQAAERYVLLVINYHSRCITGEDEYSVLEHALKLCACSPNTDVLTLSETVRRYPELVRKSNEAAMNIVPQWQVPTAGRARVVVYRRVSRRLGLGGRLEHAYSSAQSLYWQGKYDETCSLTPSIDRQCKHLQMSGRLAVCAFGVIVGVLCWAIVSRVAYSHRILWYIAVMMIMGLFGTAVTWCLRDKNAQRETLVAEWLNIVGAMCGIASGELAMFLYS